MWAAGSTHQFFLRDPGEQRMLGEVFHHPDVHFLHVCHGVHQTLTPPHKHKGGINNTTLGRKKKKNGDKIDR